VVWDNGAGRNAVFWTREAARVRKMKLKWASFAVQGYGNAGSNYAEILQELGGKLVAAADSQGAVLSKKGIDAAKLLKHKEKVGTVVGMPGTEKISEDELLRTECDILVPAALENAITKEVATGVRAKVIGECSNGPTAPEARKVLDANGVFVVPDILANSGGVIVRYLEWVQTLTRLRWTEEEVNAKLEDKITRAFSDVKAISH